MFGRRGQEESKQEIPVQAVQLLSLDHTSHPINDMAGNNATPLHPVEYKRRRTKTTAPWAIGLVVAFALAAMWVVFAYQIQAAEDTDLSQRGLIMTAGLLSFCVAVLVLCFIKIGDVRQYNQRVQTEDDVNVAHLQTLDTKRLDHRVAAMGASRDIEIAKMREMASMRNVDVESDAKVQVARYEAQATIEKAMWEARGRRVELEHGRDEKLLDYRLQNEALERERDSLALQVLQEQTFRSLEAERDRQHQSREAANDRQHRASESAHDRQATLEQMITRFEGKINELKIRMEYEQPSAVSRMQEEVILIEGFLAQARRINEIDDAVLRKQMFDRLKQGWK